MLSLLFVFLSQNAFATEFKLGTFSLVTEAGWTAWFELKSNNEALVSPAYDTEETETETSSIKEQKPTPRKGKWKNTANGIEITYGNITDRLKFEPRCKEWDIHPCFRFLSSMSAKKEKSLLEYKQPYVNWDWKIDPPTEAPANDLEQCRKECAQMATKKQLRPGMDVKGCIKATCNSAL